MNDFNSTKQLGDYGENLAADYLMQHGYRLLCRNFRRHTGEIDLIAEKDGVTYFVEVKSRSRSNFAPAAVNVTTNKRHRIARTAALWFAEHKQETASSLLVIEVYLDSGQIVTFEDFLA